MAFPTFVGDFNTYNVNYGSVGPWISSTGAVYILQNRTTAGWFDVIKATDPTVAFSSVLTITLTAQVNYLAAYQVGDLLHIAVTQGSSASCQIIYRVFDMATDTVTISETVTPTAYDNNSSTTQASHYVGIVVRPSDGQPIISYGGPRVANMGSSYARAYVARRTGTNAWTLTGPIDPGGTVDYNFSTACLGGSSRVHCWYKGGYRTLTSANVLAADNGNQNGLGTIPQVTAHNDGSTYWHTASGSYSQQNYWLVSMDTTAGTISSMPTMYTPYAIAADGADLWMLSRLDNTNAALYARKSTDHGATWGASQATNTTSIIAGQNCLSRGVIFQRGANYVMGYVWRSSSTSPYPFYYDEYVVRVGFSGNILEANNVSSASSVTNPALGVIRNALANDVASTSKVTNPAAAQIAFVTPSSRLVVSFAGSVGNRNDFTGLVGLQTHIIANQTVTSIGLLMQSTYSGIHRVHLYDWYVPATPLATAAFNCTGKTAGVWYFIPITPVALVSGNYYAVVKEVFSGDGQLWPEVAGTTLDPAVSDSAYGAHNSPPFTAYGANAQYVGVDLGWTGPTALLANDVISTSKVTNPALLQRQTLLANDVISTSDTPTPTLGQRHNALANDVKSNSSVTQPSQLRQIHATLANDVKSNSSVTTAALATIVAVPPRAMHQYRMRRAA